AQREEIALHAFDHRADLVVLQSGARQPQPRVQLVDVSVGRDAWIRFRDARAVEQAGLPGVAGPGVDFHFIELYGLEGFQTFGGQGSRCASDRRRRSAEVPTPVAGLVSALRPRPSVAADNGSVPHPRVGSDAAADAGRSRAAEVPGVAGALSD